MTQVQTIKSLKILLEESRNLVIYDLGGYFVKYKIHISGTGDLVKPILN
jgi:hypothetical protein